jgi:RNA-directed DNA polymerase
LDLLEKALSPANMATALKRVRANKGAPGIDGISTEQLPSYLQEHWDHIKEQLLMETYKPIPVRRHEIRKQDGGGPRLLGIPTVIDRLIQQALLQVLTPIFDPLFSQHSYGFRPRRKAHDAVKAAQSFINQGHRVVVDIDLEKYFDRVNHDILMARVAQKVTNTRVLKLIRAFLNAGVMVNGIVINSTEGTPQGGPLSPLLANILLDDLDKELEKRGHKFCRYADDFNIFLKTERAAKRVMSSIKNYLEKKLKLKVNESKSAIGKPVSRTFLGFSFTKDKEARIRLSATSVKRFKNRIREITNPGQSMPTRKRIQLLNRYIMGWIAYFSLCETPRILKDLEGWIRRRVRLCIWCQWKKIKTRIRNLRALRLSEKAVFEIANSRLGAWRITRTQQLHAALNNTYLSLLGLLSLTSRYSELRQG